MKYNLESVKSLIHGLIAMENLLESKLDMLTAIGTTTLSDDLWNACEEVRSELVREIPNQEGWKDILPPIGREEDLEDSGIQASSKIDEAAYSLNGLFTAEIFV